MVPRWGAITSALSEEGFNFNAVTYWGGAGAVAGLTLGLGVNAYLAATATVSVAELTATAGPAIGIAARVGTGPLVYGPSAGGRLATTAEKLGGETLNDLMAQGLKSTGSSVLEFSKQMLDEAATSGRQVLFDLTNMEDIPGVLNGSAFPDAVTSQELQYIQANWGTFQSVVQFVNNGAVVEAPW